MRSDSKNKRPLAVTMGDPAGICPELTARAWAHFRAHETPPVFFAIDDPDNLTRRTADLPIEIIDHPDQAQAVFKHALPVFPERLAHAVTPGQADLSTAAPTIRSITRAVAFVQTGDAAGVVTNPVTKKVLYDGAGFAYPGHTEFLAALCNVTTPPVMMLAGPELRVVPVTIHIPLAEVADALNTPDLLHTIEVVHRALRDTFRVPNPCIAVSGLNPHAGEDGSIGTQEQTIITPALEQAREQGQGIVVEGPLPADTLFHPSMRQSYDCAICMYHDQALIPIKMLHFDTAVNVTLGLPIVRTSPDHGTAYDIAGTGKAKIDSFLNAISMARDMVI